MPDRIVGATKMPGRSKRKNKLKQRPAIDGRARAENADQRVTGFVQGQVGAVEQRHPSILAKPVKTQAEHAKSQHGKQSAQRDRSCSGSDLQILHLNGKFHGFFQVMR
jgi:hypothetical protein